MEVMHSHLQYSSGHSRQSLFTGGYASKSTRRLHQRQLPWMTVHQQGPLERHSVGSQTAQPGRKPGVHTHSAAYGRPVSAPTSSSNNVLAHLCPKQPPSLFLVHCPSCPVSPNRGEKSQGLAVP